MKIVKFNPKKKKVAQPKNEVQTTRTGYGTWIKSYVDNETYWLSSSEMVEFDDKSLEIEDDDEFNTWFQDFVVRNKCPKQYRATSYQPRSGSVDWGNSKWSSGDTSWWRSDLYGKWGGSWSGAWGGSSEERTLAKAMQVIQSTIRIVDDSVPPMVTTWAENGMSYTDLDGRRIAINPAPVVAMKEKKLKFEKSVEICTGLGLHEAGHSNGEYGTRSVHQQIFKPTPLKPLGVVGILSNIIEDIRTERETVSPAHYPGFAGYLRAALDYTWGERSPEHNPTSWKTIPDAMNALIIHLKWPEHSAELLTDQSFKDELPWWDAWNADYQSGKTTLRAALQAALDRLAMDPDRKTEMEKMAANERFLSREGIEGAVRRAMEDEHGKQVIADSCTGHVGDDEALDSETAKRVGQFVQEKLHEEEIRIPEKGRHKPKIWVRKPIEDGQSKAAYIGKPGNIVERLKAVLQFRPELARYFTRLQKTGQIDEEELWRWGDNDYRVFQQQNIEVYPKAHVALLVDMSGSMCSYIHGTSEEKVEMAQRLAQLLILALKDMEGVTPHVYGHTGDVAYNDDGNGTADFMHIWEPNDPLTRLGLISALEHGNNYDGYAINWVVDQVLERAQPDDQCIVIVLSDGYPAGSAYGYGEAMDHVREVVDDAENKGVYVIQVAIDNALRPADQGRMFKHWLQFESADKLPIQLSRVVSKVMNTMAQY